VWVFVLVEAVGAALVEVGGNFVVLVLVVVWLGFGVLLAALQGGGSVALDLVGEEEGVARTLLLLLLLVVCCVFGVEEGHFGRGVLRG